jgi:hypothetical protein
MALLGSILNRFAWEYAHYVDIKSPEGMASSDFLMANQIAWLGKYPCFEQDGCNISYHGSIGPIFLIQWTHRCTGGHQYRNFQYDPYIRCNLYYDHTACTPRPVDETSNKTLCCYHLGAHCTPAVVPAASFTNLHNSCLDLTLALIGCIYHCNVVQLHIKWTISQLANLPAYQRSTHPTPPGHQKERRVRTGLTTRELIQFVSLYRSNFVAYFVSDSNVLAFHTYKYETLVN